MATSSINYSVFAIPAYYILSMLPHVYGTSLLTVTRTATQKDSSPKLKPGQSFYNLPNPRSQENAEKYAKILDRATFQKWERARAAHNNMMESSAFVISAFVLGIVTNLPASYMNKACALYLGSRIAYIIAYIRAEKGLWAFGRTFWWFLGNSVLGALFWQAGKKVMYG